MTLVYDRKVDDPATHAYIIGCGRFRTFKADGSADRPGTVAGARDVAKFLIDHEDDLIAPLASVECVLSDPAVAQGADRLGIGAFAHDPRENDAVDPALTQIAELAGHRWIQRCRPRDTMFFYMSSHGFVDTDYSAIGSFEDLGQWPHKPWAHALNVSSLATGLPTIGGAGCFVFLDACQEVVPDVFDLKGGSDAVNLISSGLKARTRTSVRSVALASARFGKKAWAPDDGTAPHFTKALLEGMASCCVEAVKDEGWVVTGRQLMNGIELVADAALDYAGMQTEPLVGFNQRVNFLRVKHPQIPIAIRTKIESEINAAHEVIAEDAKGGRRTRDDKELTWRFRVPPDRNVTYLARALFKGPPEVTRECPFPADAPAQTVVL